MEFAQNMLRDLPRWAVATSHDIPLPLEFDSATPSSSKRPVSTATWEGKTSSSSKPIGSAEARTQFASIFDLGIYISSSLLDSIRPDLPN
jgi:hypothetical protein